MESENLIRLLLVEDNDDHADLICEVFADQGVHSSVERVDDGETALAFLRREGEYAAAARPNLVVLDLKLPGISGIEVLKEIKGDPELMEIPVIVLSTSNAPKDRELAYEWCANSFVTKPVDYDGLVSVCRSMLQYWTHCNQPPA